MLNFKSFQQRKKGWKFSLFDRLFSVSKKQSFFESGERPCDWLRKSRLVNIWLYVGCKKKKERSNAIFDILYWTF